MRKLLDILMGRSGEAERILGEKLRDEARHIEPHAPPHSRRRVMERIAGLEPAGGHAMHWRSIGVGTALAAAIVAVVMLQQDRKLPAHLPPDESHYGLSLPTPEMPVATVQRLVGEPMESELRQLLNGLDSTKETVRAILPAGSVKQNKDSTGRADRITDATA